LLQTNTGGSGVDNKRSFLNFEGVNMTNSVIDVTHSYFRQAPVYKLPGNVKFKKIREMLYSEESKVGFRSLNTKSVVNDSTTLEEYFEMTKDTINYPGIIDVEISEEKSEEKLPEPKELKPESLSGNYTPKLEIFTKFNEMGGVDKILSYAMESLQSGGEWLANMQVENWELWIEEIRLYSMLPGFLEAVIANKDMVQCLFDIFARVELTKKDWTTRENTYVCMLYDC
jgi:hypothetical protein